MRSAGGVRSLVASATGDFVPGSPALGGGHRDAAGELEEVGGLGLGSPALASLVVGVGPTPGCETISVAVRRIIPYHESSDFDATRAFYAGVLKLEEGSFGGGYIGFGSSQAQVVFAPPGVEPV